MPENRVVLGEPGFDVLWGRRYWAPLSQEHLIKAHHRVCFDNVMHFRLRAKLREEYLAIYSALRHCPDDFSILNLGNYLPDRHDPMFEVHCRSVIVGNWIDELYRTWPRDFCVNLPEVALVNLGTSHGKDRVSGFLREGNGASGWISPNRIMFQESSVAPGATATYSFWMKNGGLPAGTYREYFQLVADGVGWMEDYGIYWGITARSGTAPTPTPTPTPTATPSPTPQPGYCLNMSNYAAPPTINVFPYSTTAAAEYTFSSPEREPSGLVYIPDYDSIFTVDDGGDVARLSTNLDLQHTWTISGDLEGITYDPATNKIYIAHEWPRNLDEYVFDPGAQTLTLQRTFDLSGVVSCSDQNSCIEGVTFVPVESDEGGVFYVGRQEGGIITVVEVALVTEPAFDPRTYGGSPVINPPSGITSDISDLYFKPQSGLIYTVFDSYDRMSVLDTTDNSWIKHFYLPSHSVPGSTQNEEGITFDDNCAIHIGEDTVDSHTYGRVRRFDQ